MEKYPSIFCAFMVFISVLLSGCIAIRKDLVPKAEPTKPLSASAQPARIMLHFELDTNQDVIITEKSGLFEGHNVWEWHTNILKEEAKKSGLIIITEQVEDKRAIKLNVRAKYYMSRAGQIATMISMIGLIPSWPDFNFELYVIATTPEGKSFRYEIRDELCQINFLPLIFVSPFKFLNNDIKVVTGNLYDTLFFKMQEDGVLPL